MPTPQSDQELRKAFDEKLGYQITVLSNLLARPFYSGIGSKYRISLNEWRMLLVVKFHPNISATDVGDRTGLQKMAVSRGVAHLLELGYIGTGPDPVDGRRKIINLTRAGRAVFDAVFPRALEREYQIRSGLTDEEHQTMLRLIQKVNLTLRALDKG